MQTEGVDGELWRHPDRRREKRTVGHPQPVDLVVAATAVHRGLRWIVPHGNGAHRVNGAQAAAVGCDAQVLRSGQRLAGLERDQGVGGNEHAPGAGGKEQARAGDQAVGQFAAIIGVGRVVDADFILAAGGDGGRGVRRGGAGGGVGGAQAPGGGRVAG